MEMLSKIHILDDDQDNLEIIEITLKGKGYDTAFFTDARTCFEASAEAILDPIITDVNMPGMNGFEFCEVVRSGKS